MIDHYDWPGGREAMLRFGPAQGPVVVLAMPLFEEANRLRALAVTMLRALAERGVASALPDLPGTGESSVQLEDVRLSDWQDAFHAATHAASGRRCHVAAIRGGALLTATAEARARWLFAPVTGTSIIRDLVRARQVTDREAGGTFDPADIDQDGPPIELAGNILPRQMLLALRGAQPDTIPPCRVVRLVDDPRPADRTVAGQPLWRRAEPDHDASLAQALADDIAEWVGRCES
ncbi:MAG: hypothetical protein ACTHMG_03250 [Sphingomonas sp.]